MIISYSFSAVAGRMTVGYICRSHSVGRTIPLFCSLLVDKTAELFAQSRKALKLLICDYEFRKRLFCKSLSLYNNYN